MNMDSGETVSGFAFDHRTAANRENNFTFPSGPSVSEDDDEVTELKIRAFLDEKVIVFSLWFYICWYITKE